MGKNYHAVLIGFNKYKDQESFPTLNYAKKDAEDLYDVLTHRDYGEFDKENVTLINDDNPKRTEEIEEILYKQVVKGRSPDDTVLVYYSGHGFIASERSKVYLATPDITMLDILNNPKAGLGMFELYNDIFLESKARDVIFILDNCFSGSFNQYPSREDDENIPLFFNDVRNLFLDNRMAAKDGKVAFVSCSEKGYSRESHEFQNGLFTYFLLNGLKGSCNPGSSGEVALRTLADYVDSMMPSGQKPKFFGKPNRVVLTKPGVTTDSHDWMVTQRFSGFHKIPESSLKNELHCLENPIGKQIEYVYRLVDNLRQLNQDDRIPLATRILSAIRTSLDAEFVFVRSVDLNRGEITKAHSDFYLLDQQLDDYEENIVRFIYPLLYRKKAELLSVRYGYHEQMDKLKGLNQKPQVIVVPLKLEEPKEFIVVCGVDDKVLEYGEIIGHALITLYNSTSELTSFHVSKIESSLLDEMKRSFSNLPHETYHRRFSQFIENLHQLTFYFEPVVHIGKNVVEIDSWEALARDPLTLRAPTDLFAAAELWGPQFITELDLYCLTNALTSYISIWNQERPGQKFDQLSINVYPETLFRTAYKKELFRLIKQEGLMFGDKLILEISEKRPLPKPDDEIPATLNLIGWFEAKLRELSKEFNISFSIDDFGVEYSSVSRMAHLELAHVKIDRDILLHPFPGKTISYVHGLVGESHSHNTKVVIEGFDENIQNITLSELFGLGIEFIQGHLIKRAAPNVSNLTKEKHELIMKLING